MLVQRKWRWNWEAGILLKCQLVEQWKKILVKLVRMEVGWCLYHNCYFELRFICFGDSDLKSTTSEAVQFIQRQR